MWCVETEKGNHVYLPLLEKTRFSHYFSLNQWCETLMGNSFWRHWNKKDILFCWVVKKIRFVIKEINRFGSLFAWAAFCTTVLYTQESIEIYRDLRNTQETNVHFISSHLHMKETPLPMQVFHQHPAPRQKPKKQFLHASGQRNLSVINQKDEIKSDNFWFFSFCQTWFNSTLLQKYYSNK